MLLDLKSSSLSRIDRPARIESQKLAGSGDTLRAVLRGVTVPSLRGLGQQRGRRRLVTGECRGGGVKREPGEPAATIIAPISGTRIMRSGSGAP